MKRFLIILLVLSLCLCGCRKKETDISGLEETPEGVDWRLWDSYTSATLTLGAESVSVLLGLDEISLVIYYDREEQEELARITIPDPLSDLSYSKGHLRVTDQNEDGYDDICIPDMLSSGDRVMNWWLWDVEKEGYVFASEYAQTQENVGGDVSWMEGKHFVNGSMDTPDGSQDLLILVEENQILVYLDERDQILWGTAEIPADLPLSREDLLFWEYWDCWDLSGDEWGDLQVPYRWEETADGGIYQYNYCWIWDTENRSYVFDAEVSAEPVIG